MNDNDLLEMLEQIAVRLDRIEQAGAGPIRSRRLRRSSIASRPSKPGSTPRSLP